MSILVGIDLQSVDEVEASLLMFGDRYTRRLFTKHEIDVCSSSPHRAQHLAARFAAKEAVMKILDVRDQVPPWRAIEVCESVKSAPTISLSGVAAELAQLAGILNFSLSMSHDGGVAIATVIAETVRLADGVTNE